MLNNDTILRRLSLVKYLFKLGYTQSQLPENMAYVGILHFHDAIEMFLKLAAEKENVKSDNLKFIEYWEKIPTLTLKESMARLNMQRVNLKHKGVLPAKQDLEISRVNTTDFFEQNTPLLFGVQFRDISMLNLVSYETVRNFLQCAYKDLEENKHEKAAENAGFAFAELINCYEKSKKDIYRRSPFFFGDELKWWSMSSTGIGEIDKKFDQLKKGFEAITEATKIICLNLDYRKFMKFKLLTPHITRTANGNYFASNIGDAILSKANLEFCIDFVVESAIRLQEFDFDLENIVDYEEDEIEYVSGTFETGLVYRPTGRKIKRSRW